MKITKESLLFAARIAAGYLTVFLIGKLMNPNPGLPWSQWLMDNNPMHHSYLFGWLIMHERYWTYSVVAISTAMLGMCRFSGAMLTGFTAGLALGEAYHFFCWDPSQTGFPYSWRIWLVSLIISIVAGIILEWKKKKA